MTLPGDSSLALRIPAIEYHDTEYKGGQTVQMTTAWFLAQLQWLSENGYHALSNEEILRFVQGEYQPPKRSCFLRFDVGIDYRMQPDGSLVMAKSSYYCTL